MPLRLLSVALLALLATALVHPPSGQAQSFTYTEDCISNVDNATVQVSPTDSLTLPGDVPIEVGDTLAVYTEDGTCAGYDTWTRDGITVAAAGPDTMESSDGYSVGETLKFEVYDVSSGTAIDLDSTVTYQSCIGDVLSLCRDDGRYANGTIHRVIGFGAGAPLPVKMAGFTASVDGAVVVLTWETASETENSGFEVQHRDPDAPDYQSLGFVEGAGSTSQSQSYRFRTEALPPGSHQFRLRQVDTDGSSSFTEPVRVTIQVERKLALHATGPNPTRRRTQLTFTVKQSGPVEVILYNLLGQQVKVLYDHEISPGHRHSVDVIVDDLSSGTYFARLYAPSGTKTQRVVVVR